MHHNLYKLYALFLYALLLVCSSIANATIRKNTISTHKLASNEISKPSKQAAVKKQKTNDELTLTRAHSISSIENYSIQSNFEPENKFATRIELGFTRFTPVGELQVAQESYKLQNLGALSGIDISLSKRVLSRGRTQIWVALQLGFATQKINLYVPSGHTYINSIRQLYFYPSVRSELLYQVTKNNLLFLGLAPEFGALLLTQSSSSKSSVADLSKIGTFASFEAIAHAELTQQWSLKLVARYSPEFFKFSTESPSMDSKSLKLALGWTW